MAMVYIQVHVCVDELSKVAMEKLKTTFTISCNFNNLTQTHIVYRLPLAPSQDSQIILKFITFRVRENKGR